jgi:hypothetical protein
LFSNVRSQTSTREVQRVNNWKSDSPRNTYYILQIL